MFQNEIIFTNMTLGPNGQPRQYYSVDSRLITDLLDIVPSPAHIFDVPSRIEKSNTVGGFCCTTTHLFVMVHGHTVSLYQQIYQFY